ncbi:MAG: hypothetical protein DLM68_09865 [Hyphomicrobiales bacterium]|nr:MAG: hypothetical protein DLM68_09865 [Hyphomicrobiales bacterium]
MRPARDEPTDATPRARLRIGADFLANDTRLTSQLPSFGRSETPTAQPLAIPQRVRLFDRSARRKLIAGAPRFSHSGQRPAASFNPAYVRSAPRNPKIPPPGRFSKPGSCWRNELPQSDNRPRRFGDRDACPRQRKGLAKMAKRC